MVIFKVGLISFFSVFFFFFLSFWINVVGNLLRNSHSKHVNIEEAVGSQILILPAYAWTGGCCIKHKLRCSLTVIHDSNEIGENYVGLILHCS